MNNTTKKTLHLVLKRKWFEMILSDEKKEEYRGLNQYWVGRLMENTLMPDGSRFFMKGLEQFRQFDTITFQLGYAKDAPRIIAECKGIDIGPAKPEWSDNWQGDVFRIKIGRIILTLNCTTLAGK